MWFRILTACVLCVCLASCGGGSGGHGDGVDSNATPPDDGDGGATDPPSGYVSALNVLTPAEKAAYETDFLSDFAVVTGAATAGGQTPFVDPPVAGSITYDGYMQLIMGNRAVSANVIGAATLQLDMTNAEIAGTATGFQGVTDDEFDFPQVAHYDGVVTISDGTIDQDTNGHYALGFGVTGVLDNGLNSFAIDGNLIGTLYGAGADGLHVIGSYTNIHGNMDITIDGVDTPQDIGIATVSALKQ